MNFDNDLLERFCRYAAIGTQSNRLKAQDKTPSTDCQWDLINLLMEELQALGIKNIYQDEHGYTIARIPASSGCENLSVLGFMAHVDTASDAPGDNVKPQIHTNYDGRKIELADGLFLDPEGEDPLLKNYIGGTIISSDGTTLLGADDKAGIAEIMTALEIILKEEKPHPPLEIVFTPDEETGVGMNRFPFDELKAEVCYTMDGGQEGEIEDECYNAYIARVKLLGVAIHPGYARGKMVNALTMAAQFINLLPRNESPEATDGRYGNYWTQRMAGTTESAELDIMIRDFDLPEAKRRCEAVEKMGAAVEAAFPGSRVEVAIDQLYLNMKEEADKRPSVMARLEKALDECGVIPVKKSIRGGTDGARMAETGVPSPNIFAGGVNFHSRREWVALLAMEKAVNVIMSLCRLWSEQES